MKADIHYVKLEVSEIKSLIKEHIEWETKEREDMKNDYVSKDQFLPVKLIVYGLVGLILTGVISALIFGVLK